MHVCLDESFHFGNGAGGLLRVFFLCIQVDPDQPGGYTKKSLPLEKKAELYPNFIAVAPRGLVPGIEHAGKQVHCRLKAHNIHAGSAHPSQHVCRVCNGMKLIVKHTARIDLVGPTV